MVTPEERITRLEAIQETNSQQLALVLCRFEQLGSLIEASRQEAREDIRALRQEAHQLVDGARRDARNLFIAALSIGAAMAAGLGGGIIALEVATLQGLPS